MEEVTIPRLLIRPVLRIDLDTISSLEKLCFKDPYPSYFISQLAEANPETFLVAIIDDALVGYAVVDRWSGHNHLISIAVHPDRRGKGIGTGLMAALQQELEKGRPFRLEVRKSNLPALEFYRRHGFHKTGVVEGYYSDGEDAILMEKTRDLRQVTKVFRAQSDWTRPKYRNCIFEWLRDCVSSITFSPESQDCSDYQTGYQCSE